MSISLQRDSSKTTINIYTTSFRLVRRIIMPLIAAGKTMVSIDRMNFLDLSNGSYYYSVIAEGDSGESRSKSGVLVIIK